MKHIIRAGAISGALLLCASANPIQVGAVGETVQNVVISELSPESASSASDEYVVLYNPNTSDVDVTGWQIQYRSASRLAADAAGWATKATLGCEATNCPSPTHTVIGSGETRRLESMPTGDDDALPFSSGMATTGGEVRLVVPKTATTPAAAQDMVGYGNAAAYEGLTSAPEPKAGQSIARRQDNTGAYLDTNDNGADFVLSANEDVDLPTTVPDPDNVAPVANGAQDGAAPRAAPATYLAPMVTEVFPDPASPQLDSADEFIELYNPYDTPIDLAGYVLNTGATWSYKYVILDATIQPGQYLAFTSSQTHLTLSNGGSGVRLYDPNGALLAEAPTYGKALTGEAWVSTDTGQWVWTTQPTPGASNVIALPAVVAKAAPAASTSAKKASTAKTTSAKKVSTPKTKKTASTGSVKGASTTDAAELPQQASGSNSWWIIAAVGAAAGGYALYEYRQEAAGLARRSWQSIAGRMRRG